MTTDLPGGADTAAQPQLRPGPLRLFWYILGGSLPARHASWVLHDTTCRTWWVRHFARTMLIIVPLFVAYMALMPASLAIRLLTGLTFSGGVFLFSLVNILVDTDRRAVRAGYASGYVSDVRSERTVEQHRRTSYQRRERIAERQARRRQADRR